ncbi:MAG: hypothetical protein L0Y60_13020, partial [Beijerinckiaceae bacterium]|nr:hypothetical protein [Beijerinckiaceae bacterium]
PHRPDRLGAGWAGGRMLWCCWTTAGVASKPPMFCSSTAIWCETGSVYIEKDGIDGLAWFGH